jgi:hypothetical protein
MFNVKPNLQIHPGLAYITGDVDLMAQMFRYMLSTDHTFIFSRLVEKRTYISVSHSLAMSGIQV